MFNTAITISIFKKSLLISSILQVVLMAYHAIVGYSLIFDFPIIACLILFVSLFYIFKKKLFLEIYLIIFGVLNIIACTGLVDNGNDISFPNQLISQIGYAIVLFVYGLVYFIMLEIAYKKSLNSKNN